MKAELQLSSAWAEYDTLAQQVQANRMVVGAARQVVLVSVKVLEALDSYIGAVRRGDDAGCYGDKAPEWRFTLGRLNRQRAEFAAEHRGLVHRAYLEAAFACVVVTKRETLALAVRPSPEEFSSIVRAKCSEQAEAMNAAANNIEGLTPEQRAEANRLFDLAVSRAVNEYRSATK